MRIYIKYVHGMYVPIFTCCIVFNGILAFISSQVSISTGQEMSLFHVFPLVSTVVYRAGFPVRGPGAAGGHRPGLCVHQPQVHPSTQQHQHTVLQGQTNPPQGQSVVCHLGVVAWMEYLPNGKQTTFKV